MKEPIEEKVVKGSPLAGITFKRREREGESEKGGETSGKREGNNALFSSQLFTWQRSTSIPTFCRWKQWF